jgi:Outer membrane protein and related peptidoglycan-associated (lipo)proteins
MNRILGAYASESSENEHWMSVSDLMAGLMIVFLFVAVAMMHFVRIERDRIKEIAMAYRDTQVSLYKDLNAEFEGDLPGWSAEIDPQTLEVRFLNPDMLFEPGRAQMRPSFSEVMRDFIPRYFSVVLRYRDKVEEVRIEGHTSSDWAGVASVDEAYFNNMALAQSRTREVLALAYALARTEEERSWVRKKIAAVGYSSARPVLDEAGSEDVRRSRRVSFRVITDSETQIKKIIHDTPEG